MANPIEMIAAEEVARRCGWRNRISVYRHAKNDPSFPKPRQISPNRTAWLASEVDNWLSGRPVASAYLGPQAA